MATLNLTERDIDALARIAHAEAGNQSIKGRNAVAAVVINRAIADSGGFKNTVPGVIAQSGQFEPMKGKTKYTQLPKAPASTNKAIKDFANGYVEGRYPDPTNGATFFQNVDVTNKRKSNFAKGDLGKTTKIGDHTFYNRYGSGEPVPIPKFGASDFEQLGTNVSVPAARPDPKSVTPSPLVDSPVDRPTSYSGAGASAPNMLGTPAELTNFAADDIVPAGEVWNAIEKLSGAPAAALSGAKQAAGDIYNANTANTSAVVPPDFSLSNRPGTDVSHVNQGAIRNRPVTGDLETHLKNAVDQTYGPGYTVEIYSGGQKAKGSKEKGSRTGSTRHDLGMAADLRVKDPEGRTLTGDELAPLAQNWRAAGYGGVGLEMGKGGIHLDQHANRGANKYWSYGNMTPAQLRALGQGNKGNFNYTQRTLPTPQIGGRQAALDALQDENAVPSVLTPEEQEVFNTPEEIAASGSGMDPTQGFIQGTPDVDSGLMNQELTEAAPVPNQNMGIPDVDSGLLNQELTEPAPAPQGTPQGIPDIDSGLLNQELTEPASVLSPQEQAVFNTPGEVDQAGSPFVTPDPAPPSRADQLMEEILQERAAMRGDLYENMPRTQGPYTAGETPAPAPTVEGPVEESVPPQGLPEGMGTPSAYEDLQRRSMGPPSVLSPQEQAVFGMGMPSAYEDIQRNQSGWVLGDAAGTEGRPSYNPAYQDQGLRPNSGSWYEATRPSQAVLDRQGVQFMDAYSGGPTFDTGALQDFKRMGQESIVNRPDREYDSWSDLRDDSTVPAPSYNPPTTASLGGFQDVSYEQPRSNYYQISDPATGRSIGDYTDASLTFAKPATAGGIDPDMGSVTGVYDVPKMDYDWGVPEAPAPAPKTRSLTPPATAPESPPEPSVGGPVRQTGWTRQTNGITRGAVPIMDEAWDLRNQREIARAAHPGTPGFFTRMQDKMLLGGVQSPRGRSFGRGIGSVVGANIGNAIGAWSRDNYTGMHSGGLPNWGNGTFVGGASAVDNSSERNPFGYSAAGNSVRSRDSDTGWTSVTNFRNGAGDPRTTIQGDSTQSGRQSGGDPLSRAIDSWF